MTKSLGEKLLVGKLSEPSKILFYLTDPGSDRVHGPIVNAINVAQSVSDNSIPAVFVFNGSNKIFSRLQATGVDVRRSDFPISSRRTHLNPFYRRKYSRIVGEFLESNRISIVHMFPRATYLMHYIASQNVSKVVEQLYASPNPKPLGLFDGGFSLNPRALASAWYRKYVRLNYKPADLVISHGEGQRSASTTVFGVPSERTTIVTPGIPSQKHKSNSGKLRQELGLDGTQKIVVSLGRITRAKGVEEFGEIASIISKRRSDISFVFVGAGTNQEYEDRILNQYGQFVTFLGHRADVPNILEDSDLYLHPSHREGLPLSIIESMEFELPALAWDIPGCNELISDGENGILRDFGDIEGMAESVMSLVSDPAKVADMGSAARKKFALTYDIAQFAPRLIEAYKSANLN